MGSNVNPPSLQRIPVSDAVRAVLCALASGDLTRPVPWGEIGALELLPALYREGLIGLAHRYTVESPHRDAVPSSLVEALREAHLVMAMQNAVAYHSVSRILRRLVRAAPPFLIAKGPAVAETLYPGPWLRSFNDLDLIVHQSDWQAFDRLLGEAGFEPTRDARVPLPPLSGHDTIYERSYHHPTAGIAIDVHYDDLLNCGLAARDVEGFWRRSRAIAIEGHQVRTLAPGDQLIHLCAHAHYHGYTRLIWLSDLAFLLRDHWSEVDWQQTIATVRREEAQVPMYYTLRLLEALVGVTAPTDLVAQVRPDRLRRAAHEFLMPERDLIALRPMWRPDLSFYFLPLFKRLLPDLVIMGRRRDKLSYLLRLVAPPPRWLRHYYHLSSTTPVWPHYLLHPLKIAHHYLVELAIAARLRRLRLDEDDLPYLRDARALG